MIIVTEQPIDPEGMYARLDTSGGGSAIYHYAVVRGRTGDTRTTGIHFERGGDMEAELEEIARDLAQGFALDDVVLARRLGSVRPGDIISLVAVCAPRSANAIEGCHQGV